MSDALPPVIAVDGPAASGKGTIAQGVAQALGFHYLDSGALYRLVAFKALALGIAPDQEAPLAAIAAELASTFVADRILLDGVDATTAIRSPEVSAAASLVAVHPGVRRALLTRQRAFRRPPGLVADGRDMGTVVFPDASCKVYVTASAEERARRRYKQLIEKGNSVTLPSLLRDIQERDARDGARAAAPLRPAADAIILDTTGMSVAASITFVLQRYRALAAGKTQ
ncbi:MAG TPA: (d)CMP kinase [Casimicrobiaceae bacterium]|jgi:cytidylate kinase|nr:(d)CMP kinase [Casimicrobiaceae bacterium]